MLQLKIKKLLGWNSSKWLANMLLENLCHFQKGWCFWIDRFLFLFQPLISYVTVFAAYDHGHKIFCCYKLSLCFLFSISQLFLFVTRNIYLSTINGIWSQIMHCTNTAYVMASPDYTHRPAMTWMFIWKSIRITRWNMDSMLMLIHSAPVRNVARDGERCWHVIGRILFLDSQGEDSCRCQSLED